MSHLLDLLKSQQDANYKTAQRQTARTPSEIKGQKTNPLASSLFYVQNDSGRNMAAPIYALQDVGRSREETRASQLDVRGPTGAMTRDKASPSYDRSAARQRSQTPCRRPNQQQSALQFDKTTAVSWNPTAARNKSTECSVMQANVAKAGSHQTARTTAVGFSRRPTSSATVTKCTRPAPRPPHTSHPLQRHVHGGKTSETKPPTKTVPTYSVKKPLPHKADCGPLRSRTMSAAKNSSLSASTSPSSGSLFTQISNPHWRHDDINYDDHDAVTADKLIPGTVSTTGSRPQLAPVHRTPTPTPSVRQLRDDGRGHGAQQQARADITLRYLLQQPYVNGPQPSKAQSCNKGRRDDLQIDEVSGTVRSHSSASEQGVTVTNRYDNHYYIPEQQVCHEEVVCPTHVQAARKSVDNVPGTQQPMEQHRQTSDLKSSPSRESVSTYRAHHRTSHTSRQVCRDQVDCPTHHVQAARKSAGNVHGTQQQQQQPIEQYRQTSDLKSSASRESVSTYRAPHRTSRASRQPPPTMSVSTLATDAGLPVTKPVPVAPSGPAGHRRVSRIPTPKFALRPMPSTSAMSTISRSSSVASLHPEFNFARPMPIERIPFCKFGMECIVPLARQVISIIPVDAFFITGVSGQRKRFLPLTENVVEDFWERTGNAVAPLPISKAQYDAGERSCTVSLVSSLVARPVAHAATQTRKSVLLSTDSRQHTEHRPSERTERTQHKKTRSPTRLQRKEHPEKLAEDNEDYAGLLVRIVQLLYLQTKLNASKSDKNNSAGNDEAKSANQPPGTQRTVHDERPQYTVSQATEQTNTRTYSPQQGNRDDRIGPAVTQVYPKNYPGGGHVDDEYANSWNNDNKAKMVYFDNAQPATKPWSGYQTATAADFKPNYSPRDQYDYPYDTRIPPHNGMRYGYGFSRPTMNNY